VPVGAQALGEQPRLRRLAGPVASLEDDETRDLRVLTGSGDAPDDIRMGTIGSEAGVGCGAGGRGSAAKSASHMASAPSYIVYGHRRGVRIGLRLVAIGVLLAGLTTVVVGASRISGSDTHVLTVAEQKPTVIKPAAVNPKAPHHVRPTSHRPAAPLPPMSKIPVTILNANGINGAARTLSARLSSLGYPVRYVGDAQGRGTPTMVQFHAPYGPAARRLARQIGNVRYISLPDGLTAADFRGAKIVVILGT
jgi:LytR cell envelope-related transcriptional attenuator